MAILLYISHFATCFRSVKNLLTQSSFSPFDGKADWFVLQMLHMKKWLSSAIYQHGVFPNDLSFPLNTETSPSWWTLCQGHAETELGTWQRRNAWGHKAWSRPPHKLPFLLSKVDVIFFLLLKVGLPREALARVFTLLSVVCLFAAMGANLCSFWIVSPPQWQACGMFLFCSHLPFELM